MSKKPRQYLARFNRMRLRLSDGTVYLHRRGFEIPKIGGVLLHRIDNADPGVDLHDHPWAFGSLILKGSYVEERAKRNIATRLAMLAEHREREGADYYPRGVRNERRRWSWRTLGIDEAHRIVSVDGPVWTLVIVGPKRRSPWGFFVPTGWLDEHIYAVTARGASRGLWDDHASDSSRTPSI